MRGNEKVNRSFGADVAKRFTRQISSNFHSESATLSFFLVAILDQGRAADAAIFHLGGVKLNTQSQPDKMRFTTSQ